MKSTMTKESKIKGNFFLKILEKGTWVKFCSVSIIILFWRSVFTHPTHFAATASKKAIRPLEIIQDKDKSISFTGFNDDLIPSNSVLDMNIGTNVDPMMSQDGRYRILVDPLFHICDMNAKITTNTTSFCFAVANYTGFTTFYEYNRAGDSSSLSKVSAGTSHERFQVKSKRTVLVLEARILFEAIRQKKSSIYRLKMDMQGYELSTLKNLFPLLQERNFVSNIFAECFNPNKDGVQIYQVDNDCGSIASLLETAGYETEVGSGNAEYSDVKAYKKGMATTFLQTSFAGSRNHD